MSGCFCWEYQKMPRTGRLRSPTAISETLRMIKIELIRGHFFLVSKIWWITMLLVMKIVTETTVSKTSNEIKNGGSSMGNFWFSTTDIGVSSLVVSLGKVDFEISCVEVSSTEVTETTAVNVGIGSDDFGIDSRDPGISCKVAETDGRNVGMKSAHSRLETVDICAFTGNVTRNVVTGVGCFDFIRLIIFEIAKTPLQNKNPARIMMSRAECY